MFEYCELNSKTRVQRFIIIINPIHYEKHRYVHRVFFFLSLCRPSGGSFGGLVTLSKKRDTYI